MLRNTHVLLRGGMRMATTFLNEENLSRNSMPLQTAKGVRDIPPEEKIAVNDVLEAIRSVFELSGFAPLETPILERYETLAAKFAAGEASDALKETFKLKDQGNRELGLRFDLTVPLARYVAMNPTLKMPFKRYEMGIVFRDGPIKTGRVRQFWQCDADIIGSSSMLAEMEILSVTQRVFTSLGIDIIIKVNNRKVLNGLLEQAGIINKEEALIALDKLDKNGVEGVTKELQQRGYTQKQIDSLFVVVREGISLKEMSKSVVSGEGKQGIQELEELFGYLKAANVKAQFDISLCRGLAYYTGTVFEAFLKKGPVSSSLAGGGRYDNMIGNFLGGGRTVPAMGISFGLVPIVEALKEKKTGERRTPSKILVISINTIKESLAVAQELREAGICTDFALGKGVSKNLEYASALKIPYVIILGENELKKKKVLLRDMSAGTEQLLTVKNVVQKLGNEK